MHSEILSIHSQYISNLFFFSIFNESHHKVNNVIGIFDRLEKRPILSTTFLDNSILTRIYSITEGLNSIFLKMCLNEKKSIVFG